MIEEIGIKKRKKAKHRLKARMKKRVYIILATSFFAIGIAAIINYNTNILITLARVLIYAATGIGCGFILFFVYIRENGGKEMVYKIGIKHFLERELKSLSTKCL